MLLSKTLENCKNDFKKVKPDSAQGKITKGGSCKKAQLYFVKTKNLKFENMPIKLCHRKNQDH